MNKMISYEQYLHNSAVSKDVIDVFLDASQPYLDIF